MENRRFYFVDNNHSGTIYYGTQAGFDWIAECGGYPTLWYGPVAPVGEKVDVIIREGEKTHLEKWPVEEMLGEQDTSE